MKSQLLTLLTIATLLFAGCMKEDAEFDTNDDDTTSSGIVDPSSIGYISFENLAITVDTDMEGFTDSGTTDMEFLTRSTAAATEVVNIDDYIVRLTSDSTGEIVKEWSYAEVKAITDPLEFGAGYYLVQVMSESEIPSSQWNHEIYTSSVSRIVVGDNNTTTVPAMVCSLSTIKANAAVSVDLKELFDTSNTAEQPLLVTLSIGEEEVVFTEEIMNNEDAVYFAPQEDNTTLNITLSGMFNSANVDEEPSYVPLEWFNTIDNVTAGQWRKISIKVDNYHEGQIEIGCYVEGWTTEETLGVEISSKTFNFAMVEDSIFDPDNEITDVDAPVLTLSNMNVSDTYLISSSTFDDDAMTYSPTYKATLTPTGSSTVEEVYIVMSSTNPSLLSAMEADGYSDGKMVLWGDGAVSTSYITLREDGSQLYGTLTYAGAKKLYNYVGTHTIKVVATDSEGRRLFTNLTIEVSSTAMPTVTYIDGDFDTPIDLDVTPDGGYNVVVDIISGSSSGLTNLYLEIDSPILTEEELQSISLSTSMDVANVSSTSDTYSCLKELEIPCGEEVLAQTYVSFDISTFMSLLGGLGAGTTTFTLRAIDEYGESKAVLTAIRTLE